MTSAETTPGDSRNPFEQLPKSFGERVRELLQSLQVIRDSIGSVRKGNAYQLIPLYGQMRALLTEKASHNTPLLLDIGEALGDDLTVYAMPEMDDLPLKKEALVVRMAGFPLELERSLPKQEKTTLPEFLDRSLVLYKGREYTSRDVIEWMANKAGGSHFARKVPRDYAELMSMNLLGLQMLPQALFQLGEVTLALGARILRRVCQFDLHILLMAPIQSIKKAKVIYEAIYPGSVMAMRIIVQPQMKISVRIDGIEGRGMTIFSQGLISWPGPNHILISNDLSTDLGSEIRITVNGAVNSLAKLSWPLFVPSDPAGYDRLWNKSKGTEEPGLIFGLGEIVMTGGETTPLQRAKMLLYFDNKREQAQHFLSFTPSSYGSAAPGTRDLQLHNVGKRTREGLLQEWAKTDKG